MNSSGLKIRRCTCKNTMNKDYSIKKKESICLEVVVSTESEWYKKVYEIAKKIEDKLNPGQANSSEIRDEDIVEIDNLAGVIAEYVCYDVLKFELEGDKTVEKPSSKGSFNQIDISLAEGKKTIEVRSSCVKNGIEFALFAKPKGETEEQYFDVIGPYSNEYKPGEALKDYYMRVIYCCEKQEFIEKVKEKELQLYITGGATREMMEDPQVRQIKHLKPEGGEVKVESDYYVVPLGKSLDYKSFIEIIRGGTHGNT